MYDYPTSQELTAKMQLTVEQSRETIGDASLNCEHMRSFWVWLLTASVGSSVASSPQENIWAD
jgi:hypothetical protein